MKERPVQSGIMDWTLHLVRRSIRRGLSSWNRFWFEADFAPQMRIFRTCFASLLFVCYLLRSLDLDFFYSNQGILQLSALKDLMPMKYRFSLFQIFPGTTALWVFNAIFLASLLMLALGLYPRFTAFVAMVIHISFLHRNPSASYGMDAIATFYLVYLCLADYRDPAERPGGPRSSDWRSVLGSVAFRLSQIQLCVIYGYSGLNKLRGVYWWKGEGVWSVLANFQMARFDFSWAAHFPLILTLCSFMSLFWEVYFPALVWIRPLRYPILIFGILFHLGIGLAINIPFFAALMIIIYLLFVDSSHCRSVENFFKKRLKMIQVRPVPAEENCV